MFSVLIVDSQVTGCSIVGGARFNCKSAIGKSHDNFLANAFCLGMNFGVNPLILMGWKRRLIINKFEYFFLWSDNSFFFFYYSAIGSSS